MSYFFALLFFYALAFVIVVWPLHWLLHTLTKKTTYDKRFYRQRSYWKLYFWVFGTAMLLTFGLTLLRGH
ncbi:MAG TPA: hypothetical protein PL070_01685 [Flavobacteriales bacterium]|nr:hypothetical protein [Flavobacteriales bacterium]